MVYRKKQTHRIASPVERERILNKPPRTARQVAVRVLEHYRQTGEFIAESLQTHAIQAELKPADRRLAREIVAGVIRRQATLDALIAPHVKRPRENTEDLLWLLLQIGVYELAFLDGIPPHASVNETTELARFLRRPRWTGFLNGTLRSVSRSLSDETTDSPAADAFPVSPGKYRKCGGAWFPDPESNPIGYFAAAFSFPQWLAERWQREWDSNAETFVGSAVRTERISVNSSMVRTADPTNGLVDMGFWFNSPPGLILRVNPLRTSREKVLETFAKENVPAEAGELPEAIVLKASRNVTELPGFAEGNFSVQDLTAMKAVALLNPQPGERIWDFCAAPGTKTTALAERMQNQGHVLATDIHPARLALIEDNRARLGLDIIEVRSISAAGDDWPEEPFDAVLVDVPCSNTGVLGKRVEARWRLTPADFVELPAIQSRLLAAACERVKPGGRVLYSTCSIEPEENQAIVQSLLSCRPDWKLIAHQTHSPGRPADGGFAALLKHV